MSRRDPVLLIEDIMESTERILAYTQHASQIYHCVIGKNAMINQYEPLLCCSY